MFHSFNLKLNLKDLDLRIEDVKISYKSMDNGLAWIRFSNQVRPRVKNKYRLIREID